MEKEKTVGEVMEEMRLKAGAKEYSGHSYMDLNRFAEDTRHMIVFDVLTRDSPIGDKGERMRLYLNDEGHKKLRSHEENGFIKIQSHARVVNGHLHYDRKEPVR